LCPSTHNMEVPNVSRTEYQLLNVEEEGNVSVLLENGDTKDDLNLPSETADDTKLVEDLKAAFDDGKNVLVTVLMSMGKEKIVAYKETAN